MISINFTINYIVQFLYRVSSFIPNGVNNYLLCKIITLENETGNHQL